MTHFFLLAFTFAVRNCLENRRTNSGHRNSIDSIQQPSSSANKDPVEALLELQLAALKANHDARNKQTNNAKNLTSSTNGTKQYSDCLLQNIDIYRLKALVYRDVVRNEKNKAKPFVIVVCV
jgi:hypothetical protein